MFSVKLRVFFVWGYCPTREFFTHMGTSPLLVKGCKWLLSSEGSLASHTYCDSGTVYDSHLRGPVTLTPIAERLAVERSLHVFTTYVSRGWDSNTQPSACGANAHTHCATATVLAKVL